MSALSTSEFTLPQILENSAKQYAERPALSTINGETLSYKEFYEAVQSLSAQLAEHGISFGQSVVILAENSPQWSVVYFAITCMGAVAVPVLTEFHSDSIAHIIRHSEAKAIFVSEKLFPKIDTINFEPAPLFFSIENFTLIKQGINDGPVHDLKNKGLLEFRKWKEKARRLAFKIPSKPAADDVAAIIYTSGTTGHSKGVVLTHKNIVANAAAVRSIVEISSEDRLLSILPLPHTFESTVGLVLPVLHGAHITYLDKLPTGRVLLPALAKVKPTAMLSVPLVIEKIFKGIILPKLTANRLLKFLYGISFFRSLMYKKTGKKLKAFFGGHMRILAIGGAPLAADAERFLAEAAFPYTIGYGLTECSPILSATGADKARLQSAGIALEGIAIRIADVHPDTGEGEIQAKGPNIMREYYKQPELSRESFTADGWFKTGDLGLIDKDGYVYIKGRSKNVIIGPSGENIYPEEIESFFFSSCLVTEALVYQHEGKLNARVHLDSAMLDTVTRGLPEKEAIIKKETLLNELRTQVNNKVSSFARIHKVIEQAEPFEKTATHKIKRYLYVN